MSESSLETMTLRKVAWRLMAGNLLLGACLVLFVQTNVAEEDPIEQ